MSEVCSPTTRRDSLSQGATDKTLPLLDRLTPQLRSALRSGDDGIYEAALDALVALSGCVGAALNTHLNALIVPLKRPSKSLQSKVQQTLAALEANGGPDALLIIKRNIPTYST